MNFFTICFIVFTSLLGVIEIIRIICCLFLQDSAKIVLNLDSKNSENIEAILRSALFKYDGDIYVIYKDLSLEDFDVLVSMQKENKRIILQKG